MTSIRKPNPSERRLINFLIQKSNLELKSRSCISLLVQPMKDGNMGSMLLFPEGITEQDDRQFGKTISQYNFYDEDEVLVKASLNIDRKGRLYELDLWKVDFSPLLSIPTSFTSK